MCTAIAKTIAIAMIEIVLSMASPVRNSGRM